VWHVKELVSPAQHIKQGSQKKKKHTHTYKAGSQVVDVVGLQTLIVAPELLMLFHFHQQTNALFAWLVSHQPAVLFSHNKPASSNQPAVLFSQNKPAPAISHQPTEQADPT
jgi:hypothetical protein